MAFEQKDNTGALFANKDRKTDKHANATGSALIDGVDYFVDAWTNTAKDGSKYQSLKFKRKDKQPNSAPARQEQSSYAEASGGGRGLDDDSEIPFACEWRV